MIQNPINLKSSWRSSFIKPYLSYFILTAFVVNSLGIGASYAQADNFKLPLPGVMVALSPDFSPAILKGIKIHPDNPFRFEFILDVGQRHAVPLQNESVKLIKYFLASLTVPEKDLWVNLSPYEKDRIIPESFGQTDMGRDLLAEDYLLKQITASLIYPEGEVGKKFWKRIYEEASKKYGTTNIPVNTFNKVWIVPEKAVVYENAKVGTAYVVESKLKVMLEQDYLSMSKNQSKPGDMALAVSPSMLPSEKGFGARAPQGNSLSKSKEINTLGSNIIREIVIPELTREVNEGKNFAQLRQVYNSHILATWYKKKIKDSILTRVFNDRNKIAGIQINDLREKEEIYQQYLKAFKKGAYNYIKEEVDPITRETVPRKYFSGGVDLALLTPSNATNLKIKSVFNIVSQIQIPADNQTNLAMITAELSPEMRNISGPSVFRQFSAWEDKNIMAGGADDLNPQEAALKLAPDMDTLKKMIQQRADNRGIAINPQVLDEQIGAIEELRDVYIEKYQNLALNSRIIDSGNPAYQSLFDETREILDHLLSASGMDPQFLKMYLLDDDRINAFAVRYDNKIFINIGVIKALIAKGASKEILAFVLGHELRHLFQWLDDLVDGKMPDRKITFSDRIITSHADEYDSDYFALVMMEKGGYSVRGVDLIFSLLDKDSPLWNYYIGFISHPPLSERARRVHQAVEQYYWKNFFKNRLFFSDMSKKQALTKTKYKIFRERLSNLSTESGLIDLIDQAQNFEDLKLAMTQGYKKVIETIIEPRRDIRLLKAWKAFDRKWNALVKSQPQPEIILLEIQLRILQFYKDYSYELGSIGYANSVKKNLKNFIRRQMLLSMDIRTDELDKLIKEKLNVIESKVNDFVGQPIGVLVDFFEKWSDSSYPVIPWHLAVSLNDRLKTDRSIQWTPEMFMRLYKAFLKIGYDSPYSFEFIVSSDSFKSALTKDNLPEVLSLINQTITKRHFYPIKDLARSLYDLPKAFPWMRPIFNSWMNAQEYNPQGLACALWEYDLGYAQTNGAENGLFVLNKDSFEEDLEDIITNEKLRKYILLKSSTVPLLMAALEKKYRLTPQQNKTAILSLLRNFNNLPSELYKSGSIYRHMFQNTYGDLFNNLLKVNDQGPMPLSQTIRDYVENNGMLMPSFFSNLIESRATSIQDLQEAIIYLNDNRQKIIDKIKFKDEESKQAYWTSILSPLSLAWFIQSRKINYHLSSGDFQILAAEAVKKNSELAVFSPDLTNGFDIEKFTREEFKKGNYKLSRYNYLGEKTGRSNLENLQIWLAGEKNFNQSVVEIVTMFPPSAIRNFMLFFLLINQLNKLGVNVDDPARVDLMMIKDQFFKLSEKKQGQVLEAIQFIKPYLVEDQLMKTNNDLGLGQVILNKKVLDPGEAILYQQQKSQYEDARFTDSGGFNAQLNILIPAMAEGYIEKLLKSSASFDLKLKGISSLLPESGYRDRWLQQLLESNHSLDEDQILAVLPLIRSYSLKEHWGLIGLELAKDRRNGFALLQEELDEVVKYFPQLSYTRDDILFDVMEKWGHHPEDIDKITPLLLQHADNMREDVQKKVLFGEGMLFAYVEAQPTMQRAEFMLWLMGARTDKPEWLKALEYRYKINVDSLKESLSYKGKGYEGVGKSFRRLLVEKILFGKEGVLDDPLAKAVLLGGLFDFIGGKTADPLIKDAFNSIFAHADISRQGKIITALFEELATADQRNLKNKEALKGVFLQALGVIGVKVGQALGITYLQDKADPIPRQIVFDIIAKTYGRFDERFQSLNERIGKASVKNVFQVVFDGQDKVLKVKRPDIEKTIEEDYQLFEVVLQDLQAKGYRLPKALARRVRKMLDEELNFEGEADNQKVLSRNIQDRNLNNKGRLSQWWQNKINRAIKLSFPASGLNMEFQVPQTQEVKDNVLMVEDVVTTPIKLTDNEALNNAGINPQDAIIAVRMELLRQIFIDGVYHLDPQPGNILLQVNNDRRVVNFIDLGAVGYMSNFNKWRLKKLNDAIKGRQVSKIILLLAPQFLFSAGLRYKINSVLKNESNDSLKLLGVLSVLDQQGVSLSDDLMGLVRFYAAGSYLFKGPKIAKANDAAMRTGKANRQDLGGIDLTTDKTPLEIKNSGESIKFNIDPDLLEQLQNVPGFVPVIINIQPAPNMREFWGIESEQTQK